MKLQLATVLVCISFTFASGQKKKQSGDIPVVKNAIEAYISNFQKFYGYKTFYYDKQQDKIFLELDTLGQEFLYVNSLATGVGSNDIGLDRGQLGRERVVKFERRGTKMLLLENNLKYRAITKNVEEKKSVEEAFAQSVLWGFKIEATSGEKVLVDATDFFLQDAHDVSGALKESQQGSYNVDRSRSAYYMERTKNFPSNTEVEVILTFSGQPAGNFIRSVTPTPSSVTVRQHHSFVALPDNNFKPRVFDPRSGYFSMSYFDYATPIHEPIEKRFITRHRLVKKAPSAALSGAVEPIIYSVDRGTPEPIRSALLEGARWWDQAFEAAGFKNAFRVEMMPEGADPMDVRYNVIQWVHRATRGWSYGSTVTDPRTGEIIKGHVTLGSLRVRQDYLIAEGLLAPYAAGEPTNKVMETMALARMRQLAAHEVGHTLGLAHAYSASTENFASVMDYPHPYVELKDGNIDLSHAYDDKIGAWDKVAIAYGYRELPEGGSEATALNKIIDDALASGLTFLSDQDARPRGGAHPFAHLWDNGADPTEELLRVLQIRQVALNNLGENSIKQGTPYATLEEVLVPMYFFHRYQAEAAAKLIRGLNYRYALRGDGQTVTAMVPPEKQAQALDALLKTITPTTLMIQPRLLSMIPPRPLGYTRHRELVDIRTGITFDALAAAEASAEITVGLLLHADRAARLIEYHARDKNQPSLTSVIDRLITATFKAATKTGYEGAVQISVNEVVLNNLLRLASNKETASQVRSTAYQQVSELKRWLTQQANKSVTPEREAHNFYTIDRISRFFDHPGEYKPETIPDAPPGQPIGNDEADYCGWH